MLKTYFALERKGMWRLGGMRMKNLDREWRRYRTDVDDHISVFGAYKDCRKVVAYLDAASTAAEVGLLRSVQKAVSLSQTCRRKSDCWS